MHQLTRSIQIYAESITEQNFQPYGQLITPQNDGKSYDSADAQLDLNNGIPRFYLMRLCEKKRQFHQITRHDRCTQCLGSLDGKDWFLAVAPPSDAPLPNIEDIVAFHIPSNCFVKLEVGTWHSGPYFDYDFVDFYNLELSDTNVVDHFTHNFKNSHSIYFEILRKEEKILDRDE